MAQQLHAPAGRRQGQQGFTLVELIIATMVFAIGMVAVLGSIVAIMNNHKITAAKHQAFVQLQNQAVLLEGTILVDPLKTNIGTVELPNIPGSLLNLYVARPDDPDTAGDETAIFGPLPLSQQEIDDEFGGDTPDPVEIVFEALVPMSLKPDVGDRTYYQFRMAAVY